MELGDVSGVGPGSFVSEELEEEAVVTRTGSKEHVLGEQAFEEGGLHTHAVGIRLLGKASLSEAPVTVCSFTTRRDVEEDEEESSLKKGGMALSKREEKAPLPTTSTTTALHSALKDADEEQGLPDMGAKHHHSTVSESEGARGGSDHALAARVVRDDDITFAQPLARPPRKTTKGFGPGFKGFFGMAQHVQPRYAEHAPVPRLVTVMMPADTDPMTSRAMREFVAFPGKKVLLVPEGHGCAEAMLVRKRTKALVSHTFSEGATGSRMLAGIEGFETTADLEGPVILKLLETYEGQGPIPGVPTTKEEFFEACAEYGVPRSKAEAMYHDLKSAPTPPARKDVVTKYQMHDRDRNFARHTAAKVLEVSRSAMVHISVGFMGAAHIVEGVDQVGDSRTTPERVPDFLVRHHEAHNMGRHLLFNHESGCPRDVRVFVYPKVLDDEDHARDEVTPIIRAAMHNQRSV